MLEDKGQKTTMDKTNSTSKSLNNDSVPTSPKSDYSNSNDIDKQCQTEENTLSVSSDSSITSVKVTPTKRTGGRQLTKVQEMDRELTGWINGIHADGKLNELTREMIIEKGRLIAKMKKILDFAGTTNWYTRFLRRNFSETVSIIFLDCFLYSRRTTYLIFIHLLRFILFFSSISRWLQCSFVLTTKSNNFY